MRSARANSKVKILGMIGGTGQESTVEYYRRLIAAYHARVSESGAPPIIINSVDNKNLVQWFTDGELARVIDFLAAEIARLARAGAGFCADRGGHAASWLRQGPAAGQHSTA